MDIFVAAVIVRKRNRRRENSGKNNDFLNILKKTKTKTKNNNNFNNKIPATTNLHQAHPQRTLTNSPPTSIIPPHVPKLHFNKMHHNLAT